MPGLEVIDHQVIVFVIISSPYLSADMRKMAAAFNTSVPSLEDELMQLILDGQIQARIDSHNKVSEQRFEFKYRGYVVFMYYLIILDTVCKRYRSTKYHI